MAKSKRNQVVTESSLVHQAKTLPQRKQKKADLMGEVQACLLNGAYTHFYVYRVNSFKAVLFQRMRLDLQKTTRLFFSKNRLLSAAFKERDDVEDIKKVLSGPYLGVAFTKDPAGFEAYVAGEGQVIAVPDFAKAGQPATATIELPVGPLARLDSPDTKISATLESFVRQECGLPTSLKGGHVMLASPQTVCREGEPLTPQAAKLLRVLGVPMTTFSIDLVAKYAI